MGTCSSDDKTSCIVLSETIYAVLLTHDKFGQFTPKKIVDAKSSAEVLICVTAESRGEVDLLFDKAARAGGAPDPTPTQDF